MTKWPILITILLTAGLALATARYGRSRLRPLTKAALIALRAGWVIGLILAFFEPSFRFERFETARMKIPVLVDVSGSMQNFSPELSVKPFLDTLAALQSRTGGRVSFEYFLFGDSTRTSPTGAALSFADSKSFFPAALDEPDGRLSSDMIIVTDGHWTTPRRSANVFPRNSIRYLVLPEAEPNPFVTVTHEAPETSPSDSSFTVGVTASGYIHEKGVLTVSLKEKERTVKTETAEIEPGYFSRATRFKTSNARPGRRLYTVEASIDSAIPPSVSSFVHQTVPHFLTYAMYSARPTLDRRYIAQALASNDFFREKSSSPDLLFLFDWDDAADKLLRGLPRHATAVFSGCLPCSSSGVAAPSLSIRQVDNGVLNNNLDLRAMPPPEAVIACKQLPVSGMKRLLQATINTTGDRAQSGNQPGGRQQAASPAASTPARKPDNAMILFSGRFRGTQSLFCPVRGIWRWDFWPMSSDRAESELFSFSNTLLSTAKELLLDNISDQLILYPAGALTETDSARFLMSLPAAVPIFEPVKLSVKIQNANVSIDSTFDYYPTGLNRQPLSFPALPPGRYGIASALEGAGVKAAFIDSFTVNRDMSELSVLAQNTQYLQEFAQPLDMKDTAAANSVFEAWSRRSAERSTVAETVRINKSWLLLGIILALFAAELILRRRRGVD